MPSHFSSWLSRGILTLGLATLGCGASGDDGSDDGGTGGTGPASGGAGAAGAGPSPKGGAGGGPSGGGSPTAGSTAMGGRSAGGSGAAGIAGSTGGTGPAGGGDGGTAGLNAGGAGGTSAGGSTTGGTSASGAGSGGGPSACGATGFHVKDGFLYDVECKEFVMRGVNYPYTWFSTRDLTADLNAIAATGANTVRIVMATGGRWQKTGASTLTSLINAAKAAKLVSVLEVHDTTGYSEQADSVALSNATSYWTGSDIVAALKGQEAYAIVNIGNEPNGNNTSDTWKPTHIAAVQALRTAGLNHTLMIDAPNWGQDWQGAMRDGGGAEIWAADTQKNMVFSVHMYDVYGESAKVSSYFNTFLMKYEAPLVVGEFAADHGSSGDVDEGAIMSFAETLGIGYLGWSWSGNGSGLGTLDITNNFDASSLTTWGTRLINGENGIKATSQRCTCFE
jgi:mannan endo-1,4-beta-mannosidase